MLIELLQIILLFIVPVLLIYYKIIPFKQRKNTLIIVSLIVIAIIILEKTTLKQLGINLSNPTQYLLPYLLFTVIVLVSLVTLSKILKRKPQPNFFSQSHFIYGFIIVSALQELLFRGFLFPKLQTIFSGDYTIILVNAILFTLIHSIYSNDTISIVIIFIGGIGFAAIYWIYPNLILITISHAILNFVAVLYNFYYEEKTTVKIIKE